ncbi:ATP-binding cassette domain-containing protein [Microbacterium oxydans]|nr:ATP-binding cassette domain-containing protein [Microbacterium oxydans]
MPEGQVLEFTHVTKRFNEVTAVSDFSARVEPGAVTAFLGPNGAGKTTTLRILLGQVRATSGTATIGGTAYAELRQPLRTIGSVLEETVYRPRRTAERQLTIAAKANGIPLARVGEVLSLVGLEGEGGSRIGGFSLGMRQRLSVAHALLGDPGALVFDEPANGLDPEGIRWMRLLMRRLADEGRTVLVSSHVLSEVEQVADNVLVLSKGTLVLSSGIETLADPKGGSVIVDAADRSSLTTALQEAGFDIEVLRSGLTVRGGDAGTVGAVAADAGIALSTLVQRGPTLEDVFIDLMRGGRFAPSISGRHRSSLRRPPKPQRRSPRRRTSLPKTPLPKTPQRRSPRRRPPWPGRLRPTPWSRSRWQPLPPGRLRPQPPLRARPLSTTSPHPWTRATAPSTRRTNRTCLRPTPRLRRTKLLPPNTTRSMRRPSRHPPRSLRNDRSMRSCSAPPHRPRQQAIRQRIRRTETSTTAVSRSSPIFTTHPNRRTPTSPTTSSAQAPRTMTLSCPPLTTPNPNPTPTPPTMSLLSPPTTRIRAPRR